MTLNEMLKRDRQLATAWAAAALADEGAVILDTETTGLSDFDQVIEVAVIDIHGNVLLNTLCRHNLDKVPQAASAIHGITDETLATAPTFAEIYQDLKRILQRASRVIVYNAAYDFKMLNQSRRAWELPGFLPAPFECAMLACAAFVGEWNPLRRNYRWIKLTTAALHFGADTGNCHRALGDAQMALEVIRGMAREAVQDG